VTRLRLRRGTVLSVDSHGPAARLTVGVGEEQRPALAYTELTGAVAPGDEVLVNVTAVDLELGSGGYDVVHANLTRGLDAAPGDDHVMKLNYTSLQHPVSPVELEAAIMGQTGFGVPPRPVAVLAVHGQLAPVAWAAAQRAPGARVGFVQTAGGALPGALSDTVRELRARGLLAGHVTAAPCFGGDDEAITVPGALHAAFVARGWDAAVVGPGPGIVGSGSLLGHGGLAALDSIHAAMALGCPAIVVPRLSSGDPRPRHRGLSHHTATVLELLLRPAVVAMPPGEELTLHGAHERREGAADVAGYAATGLPARSMGRDIGADRAFFSAALAGGSVLGGEIHGV
jgi:Protein of unknown function (DUF3866)